MSHVRLKGSNSLESKYTFSGCERIKEGSIYILHLMREINYNKKQILQQHEKAATLF